MGDSLLAAEPVDEGILVYSSPTCPYCKKAKALLRSKGVAFTDVDVQNGAAEVREQMLQRSGGKTSVPQIFIKGKHIGGSDDLQALEDAGGLDPLLVGIPKKEFAPESVSNIDSIGRKKRFILGMIVFAIGLGIGLGITFGVHSRWYRLFAPLFIIAGIVCAAQAVGSTWFRLAFAGGQEVNGRTSRIDSVLASAVLHRAKIYLYGSLFLSVALSVGLMLIPEQ